MQLGARAFGPHAPTHGRVFGLDVAATFPVLGLEPAADGEPAGVTRLEQVGSEELAAGWPAAQASSLSVQRFSDGSRAVTLDEHPDIGLRAFAHGFGVYVVDPDGRRVRCAPPAELEPWRWQRFLAGQVLPLAALLQGIEVFHASGAILDGGVVAFAGSCGAGKTSVAFHLALQGATVFTDDVLAVAGDPPTCHPGPAAANIRDPALREVVRRDDNPIGRVVGEDGRRTLRVVFAREGRALPLSAIMFLAREDEEGGRAVTFEEADPRLLLAHTFNVALRTPARLAAQLDLCARLAASVALTRVSVPASVDAPALATAVREHLASPVPA